MQTEVIASLPASKLTKKQVKTFRAEVGDRVIIAEVRHDDKCGNGHNSFAITAEIYEPHIQRGEPTTTNAQGRTVWLNACGCCHEEVREHFPQLAPLLKWHLTSTDGPMHYKANALYHAGHTQWKDAANLQHLKSTIVYGALPQDAGFDPQAFMYDQSAPFTANDFKRERLTEWLENRLDSPHGAIQSGCRISRLHLLTYEPLALVLVQVRLRMVQASASPEWCALGLECQPWRVP